MAQNPATDVREVKRLAFEYGPFPSIGDGAPSFAAWLDGFLDTPRGREAATELLKVERWAPAAGAEWPFSLVVHEALGACYAAAHFDEGKDPGRTYRNKLAKLREKRKALSRAAQRLAQASREHPALMWAHASLGYIVHRVDGSKKQDLHENFTNMLAGFAERLKEPLPEVGGGPWFYRFIFACLHFVDPPLTRMKSPGAATALLFNLVFIFRSWTAYGHAVHSNGTRMPSRGRPCYAAAAALTRAALRSKQPTESTAKKTLRSLLKNHRRVGLAHWPNLSYVEHSSSVELPNKNCG